MDLRASSDSPEVAEYLNELNTAIVGELQGGGEVFVSNAVLDGRYVLRPCIVNFRTLESDALAVPAIAVRVGRAIDARLRLTMIMDLHPIMSEDERWYCDAAN